MLIPDILPSCYTGIIIRRLQAFILIRIDYKDWTRLVFLFSGQMELWQKSEHRSLEIKPLECRWI